MNKKLIELNVNEFLDETASASPAPGGGSISALAAALGSALTSMVCRLTIGKKKYADVQKEMEQVLIKSEELRAKFSTLIDEDTNSFNKVMAAYGLPKETDEDKEKRATAIQEAVKEATLVPLKLIELCAEAIELVKIAAEKGNQNSLSDAGVAALMIKAGSEGATLNVKTNLISLKDEVFVNTVKTTLQEKTDKLDITIQSIVGNIQSIYQ